MHQLVFTLLAALNSLALYASTPAPTAQPTLLPTIVLPSAPAGGGGAVGLADGSWLLTGGDGLYRVAGETAERLTLGRFEALDVRDAVTLEGAAVTVVSAVDVDAGRVAVFVLSAEGVRRLPDMAGRDALPTAQCLYRDPIDKDISLFAIDDRGMVEQFYLLDAATESRFALSVRRFVGAPDVETCVVDDRNGALYLAEEGVGVWKYGAAPESDVARQPVLLQAPHGQLAGDVADLSVAEDGSLWVLVPDGAQIHRLASSGGALHWQLMGVEEPKAFALQGDTAHGVVVFDEATGAYRQAIPQVPAAPAVSESAAVRIASIVPVAETEPMARYGDAADDPAIYWHRDDPARSRILGTDKREGVWVYDLTGKALQKIPVGRLNNIDLRHDVVLDGQTFAGLAAASNRTGNSIALFAIEDSTVRHLGDVPTDLDEVYGLCSYQSDTGHYVFINDTDGRYRQYRLGWKDGPAATLVRSFALPSQPEGCVAEDNGGRIFLGEEGAGIWVADAEPDGAGPEFAIELSDALVADVEGMGLYGEGNSGMLVVSSQGSDSYAVYAASEGYPLLGSFRIRADLGSRVDGTSETDGLAVSAKSTPGFPRGMLVVQDGRNVMPGAPQNFKLIDWLAVEAVLGEIPR